MKGAYVIKVIKWGQPFYAGVGYSLIPPATLKKTASETPAAEGLYGFVCTREGRVLAHGIDAFIGKTLQEVLNITENHEIAQEGLLEKFEAASEQGGAWTCYPWRNDKTDSLRKKGAHIMKMDHPAHGSVYCCVGYFGERHLHMDIDDTQDGGVEPPPAVILPTREAAKASTTLLMSQILEEASDKDGQLHLRQIVQQHSGKMSDAALKDLCWQSTTLPEELRKSLHAHAVEHFEQFN